MISASIVALLLYIATCILVTHFFAADIFYFLSNNEDGWISLPVTFGYSCLLAIIFVSECLTTWMFFKTQKGYFSLLKNPPSSDGSVKSLPLLDGLKGKLKEVITEAGPQSILQVNTCM